MAVDKHETPELVNKPTEEGGADRSIDKNKRLESLLLDNSDRNESVDRLVDREVTAVGMGSKNIFAPLFVLVLFCLLLLGIAYFFFGRLPPLQRPEGQQNTYVSPKLPVPKRPGKVLPAAVDVVVEAVSSAEPIAVKIAPAVTPVVKNKSPLFTVIVGPFINGEDLQQAISQLQELGFQPQKKPGSGQVAMIRLLEGVYPRAEARRHLAGLKKVVKSAFLLPEGDYLAVYLGSFHQEDRARQMQSDLAQKMIKVSLVDSDVTMNGTVLAALQADQQTAREVAAHISSLGLHTQLIKEK